MGVGAGGRAGSRERGAGSQGQSGKSKKRGAMEQRAKGERAGAKSVELGELRIADSGFRNLIFALLISDF